MKIIRRFHLFPEDVAEFPFNKLPNDFGNKKFTYRVVGAKAERDRFPIRISIIKGKVKAICSVCSKKMGKHGKVPRKKNWQSGYGIVPYYYVGFVQDSCFIPRWGYEAKICLGCALKYLGEHDVYPCTVGKGFCDEIWDYVCFDGEMPEVPYPRKTFREYLEEQFNVRGSCQKVKTDND